MAVEGTHRYYIVLQDPALWATYEAADDRTFAEHLQERLAFVAPVRFTIVDRPTLRVSYPPDPRLRRLEEEKARQPMVIVLGFPDPEEAARFGRQFKAPPIEFAGLVVPGSGLSADLPIRRFDMPPFQHWCPPDGATLFSDRSAAETLIRAASLRTANPVAFDKPVSVAVFDLGLQLARFPGANPANGFAVDGRIPFEAKSIHGSMVARNAISFAAGASLFDVPILPDEIDDLTKFLSLASAAYLKLAFVILVLRALEPDRSWVLVNAWGVYDRRIDAPPASPSNYTTNPDHAFNLLMTAVNAIGADVVFSAGNCGAFCPSVRCGPSDRGPGSSIWGANSLASVLTAGAARCDATWLGYSSQGPGQAALGVDKPDVCAPSQFGEAGDASIEGGNTGTSAACGMAAGVVAGLRRRWPFGQVAPDALRSRLRQTAWLPNNLPDSKGRFGSGIIDVGALLLRLETDFP